MSNETTVADIFRRAQAIRQTSPNASYKSIAEQLTGEYEGKKFPSPAQLTIPEMDAYAPEEDWTAGLSVILRGIQTESWSEISKGITLCLDQIENFQRESGSENAPEKEWHDRNKGIEGFSDQTLSKWMPEDLMQMAERAAPKK